MAHDTVLFLICTGVTLIGVFLLLQWKSWFERRRWKRRMDGVGRLPAEDWIDLRVPPPTSG
jgi:hypothetical protein